MVSRGFSKIDGMLLYVEVYSIKTNLFSFLSPMKQGRAFFGCFIVNSYIYVIGRFSTTRYIQSYDLVEIYDIESNVWNEGPTLLLILGVLSCVSNDNFVKSF